MKSILLVRHGKSSWEYPLPDKERPLSKRGVNDINLVANAFQNKNTVPNAVFSSPANRALSTCKLFLQACNISVERIQIKDQLYDFGGDAVLNFIKNLPDTIDEAIIFGHNHAFTAVANLLGTIAIDNLPTSGLVKIVCNTDNWQTLTTGKTELIIIPKELKQ